MAAQPDMEKYDLLALIETAFIDKGAYSALFNV